MKVFRSFVSTLLVLAVVAPAAAQENHAHGASCAPSDRSVECRTERQLMSILNTEGVAAAMAELDRIAGREMEIRRTGHTFAHAIGLSAYRDPATVGDVFAECTPAFQSGCHHGVIQSYFDDLDRSGSDIDQDVVVRLCESQRGDPAERWNLFQCVHGLGHGLMMAEDNVVAGALAGCDLLPDGWEREGCYSAVFMENVVQANTARGDIGRPPAETASAGHDHGASEHAHHAPGAAAFRADDPLYPCNVLDVRYLNACYQMQTSAILNLNGFDVADAAEACAGAPDRYRGTCFQSLGRDISSITVQDHRRALRLCEDAPAAYRPHCVLGYAKNLVDLTADIAPGMAFCRLVTEGEAKRFCYTAMGEQAWVLLADEPARAQLCLAAEPGYVDACYHGAGVNATGAD